MRKPRPEWVAALLLLTLVSCRQLRDEDPRPRALFFLTELKGYLEPCGCTSRPLGGVDRTATLVAEERKRARASALLLSGDLLFESTTLDSGYVPQAKAQAEALSRALARIGVDARGQGPRDLALGEDVAASIPEAAGLPSVAPRILDIGDAKVGVLNASADTQIAAPIQKLRDAGARRVVLLVADGIDAARSLAKTPGVDLVIWSGESILRRSAERVGDAWLVTGYSQGRYLARLDLWLRGDGSAPLVDLKDGLDLEAALASLEKRIETYTRRLHRLRRESPEQTQQIAAAQQQVAKLSARKQRMMRKEPKAPPEGRDAFALTLIPVEQALPSDPEVAAILAELDGRVAKLNAQMQLEPERDASRPAFAGNVACAECHEAEQAFWLKTKHAYAWKTLVDDAKDFDLKCVGCHSVGYAEVNGALGVPVPATLRDVGCESCHGAGSFHIAEEGIEDDATISLGVPAAVCVRCHNEEHSDLFSYDEYLDHVVGPGHGEPLPKATP